MTVALPDELFVIVTKDASSVVKHNMSFGRVTSAGFAYAGQNPQLYAEQRDEWLPWIPNPAYQTFVGFHSSRVSSDMRVEYNAELTRLRYFRNLPSRLACLYAWGSLDDAIRAKTTIRGRFDGRILRCRPVTTLRSARCNSALVNFAQRSERGGYLTDHSAVDQVWRAYWSGSGQSLTMERQNLLDPSGPPETVEMSKEPLWEWLVDGALDIVESVDPEKATRNAVT
jgi:hypothetical protein